MKEAVLRGQNTTVTRSGVGSETRRVGDSLVFKDESFSHRSNNSFPLLCRINTCRSHLLEFRHSKKEVKKV